MMGCVYTLNLKKFIQNIHRLGQKKMLLRRARKRKEVIDLLYCKLLL